MIDAKPRMPGVYVDLDELIALEQRGRKVSFLPQQPVHSLLVRPLRLAHARPRVEFRGDQGLSPRRRRPLDRLEGDGATAEAACARLQRGARPAGAAGRRPAAVDVLRQPACDEIGDGGTGCGDRRLARARRRRPRRRHRVQRQRSRRDQARGAAGRPCCRSFPRSWRRTRRSVSAAASSPRLSCSTPRSRMPRRALHDAHDHSSSAISTARTMGRGR